MPQQETNGIIRFGIFEADFRAGELRRNGTKIRLQEQPLQVLVLLLAKPGELVTREELQSKLWPADTFVDFEHGLNALPSSASATLSAIPPTTLVSSKRSHAVAIVSSLPSTTPQLRSRNRPPARNRLSQHNLGKLPLLPTGIGRLPWQPPLSCSLEFLAVGKRVTGPPPRFAFPSAA